MISPVSSAHRAPAVQPPAPKAPPPPPQTPPPSDSVHISAQASARSGDVR